MSGDMYNIVQHGIVEITSVHIIFNEINCTRLYFCF